MVDVLEYYYYVVVISSDFGRYVLQTLLPLRRDIS